MIEEIENILAADDFSRIKTNIAEITLYVKYDNNEARAVQLYVCEDKLDYTAQQLKLYDDRARFYLQSKGYENVDVINIVATPFILKVRELICDKYKCWIIDTDKYRLRVYENQPQDFMGLKDKISTMLFDLVPLDDYDAITDEDIAIAKKIGNLPGVEKELAARAALYDRNKEIIRANTNDYDNSRQNAYSQLTPANTAIFALNVIVFILFTFIGSTEDVMFMLEHGAMFVPAILHGEIYRMLTSMFLHFGISHITSNMLVLMSLGDNVERAVGWKKYLIIYLGGGLIGNIGSFGFAFLYNKNVVSAGASGAIFALIGALLWIVVLNKGKLEDMTTLKIAILIIYSLYSGLRSDNIDMAAHLFGLIGGFVLAVIIYRKKSIS